MLGYIPRFLDGVVQRYLELFPAVAILGPRQCGKSTLAHHLGERVDAVYLDLESTADRRKLRDPSVFFDHIGDRLVCLDEIQMLPDLFRELRPILDRRGSNGQLLVLGSASRDLIRQSSETLAGRIGYLELTPFLAHEVAGDFGALKKLLLRGGFPRSYLAPDDEASGIWLASFIRTYLERDIPQLGVGIPANTLRRLWTMCAHIQGATLNSSKLAAALGTSHTTIRKYLDLMAQAFMVRLLPPYSSNPKKRLVKAPKVYLRDTGVLHELLGIRGFEALMGHPVYGASWEGLCLENVLSVCPDWNASFYRTADGAEVDLILEKGLRRLALEFKVSSAPDVRRGFWNVLNDTRPDKTWVVAPVEDAYPIADTVTVAPLQRVLEDLLTEQGR